MTPRSDFRMPTGSTAAPAAVSLASSTPSRVCDGSDSLRRGPTSWSVPPSTGCSEMKVAAHLETVLDVVKAAT